MKLTEVVAQSCRVCLKRATKLRSLYKPLDEGEEPPNEMLRLITGIELERADLYETLPKCICKSCELSLSMAYQFRDQVIHTHQIIESYRKQMWHTEGAESQASQSIPTQVKKELDEIANPHELNDENSFNEDHNREMKEEMLEITISDIDTLDADSNNDVEEMLEINLEENMEEECKPEYLHDEEYYNNNANSSKSPTPLQAEEDELCATDEVATFSYQLEDSQSSNDDVMEVTVNDNAPELVSTVQCSSDAAQVKDHLRTSSLKCAETANEKTPRHVNEQELTIHEVAASVQTVETSTVATEKSTNRSNQNMAHICDICGNIYAKRGRMMEHRRRHDKELRFACEICDKRFHLREKLRKHMFLHTGGKPYKCSFCSRTFFYESVKRAHEAIHSGVKPYVCDECNKAFAYAHALAKHKLIHADIKLYHCEYCGKDFRLQHHMKQHVETKLHQNAVYAAQLKFGKVAGAATNNSNA